MVEPRTDTLSGSPIIKYSNILYRLPQNPINDCLQSLQSQVFFELETGLRSFLTPLL